MVGRYGVHVGAGWESALGVVGSGQVNGWVGTACGISGGSGWSGAGGVSG